MIDLNNIEIFDNNYSSSKGNQMKWQEDNIWYKADKNGYEGLSEYVVSELLKKSSLSDSDYVHYDLEQIKYKNQIYNGCKCKNFLDKNDSIITLERIYKNVNGTSLTKTLEDYSSYKDKLQFLVNAIVEITGLKYFGEYLYRMLVIDAFFLNEDRHLHNIAVVLKKDGSYDYCPIFDNGASLLSDIDVDYPLNVNTLDLIQEVKSKTIGPDFLSTIQEAELLYGTKIEFYFNEEDIDEVVDKCNIYDTKILKRVKQVIKYQRNKMKYYF